MHSLDSTRPILLQFRSLIIDMIDVPERQYDAGSRILIPLPFLLHKLRRSHDYEANCQRVGRAAKATPISERPLEIDTRSAKKDLAKIVMSVYFYS